MCIYYSVSKTVGNPMNLVNVLLGQLCGNSVRVFKLGGKLGAPYGKKVNRLHLETTISSCFIGGEHIKFWLFVSYFCCSALSLSGYCYVTRGLVICRCQVEGTFLFFSFLQLLQLKQVEVLLISLEANLFEVHKSGLSLYLIIGMPSKTGLKHFSSE